MREYILDHFPENQRPVTRHLSQYEVDAFKSNSLQPGKLLLPNIVLHVYLHP